MHLTRSLQDLFIYALNVLRTIKSINKLFNKSVTLCNTVGNDNLSWIDHNHKERPYKDL